jgi:uncharacterized protein YehS (DUF1456 family)
MTNNDVLKRLRFIEGFNNAKLKAIFQEVDYDANLVDIEAWQKDEEASDFKILSDVELALFLNGLINFKRGKKPGKQPPIETELENNDIFKKIKIAYSLNSDTILQLFKMKGKILSKNELSAFLRNPKQDQYRILHDQYLRNFLSALQLHLKK